MNLDLLVFHNDLSVLFSFFWENDENKNEEENHDLTHNIMSILDFNTYYE
jgi:hypothetical protein